MSTKSEKFTTEDLDELYRSYQTSRDESMSGNYLESLIERREGLGSPRITAFESESDQQVDELYHQYQKTRDEHVENGIASVMQVVHQRCSRPVESPSVEREEDTGRNYFEQLKNLFSSGNIWVTVPALGATALLAIVMLPAMLGVGTLDSSAFLTHPPSRTVAANADYLSSQLTETGQTSLGFAGDASSETNAFRAGTTAVDLVVASIGENADKALSMLRQLAVLSQDSVSARFKQKLDEDIGIVSSTGFGDGYSPAELLELAQKEFGGTALAEAYELGQWVETILLESTLAARTNDFVPLANRLTDRGGRSNLAALAGHSNVTARLVAKLEAAAAAETINSQSARKIRQTVDHLKYVY